MSTKAEHPAVERDRWSSRGAFYFAAIGCAVGFGNVWRFPSLVYDYGGGAFFIPYVLALFLIGIPMLVLEIALGQYYEAGDVGVFGSIHKRLRGVGISSVACGYILVTYYSMLLAWVCNAFFDSFGDENFWAQDQVTGSEAKAYFYDVIIGGGTLDPENPVPTRMVWKNAGYSLLSWVIIYLCIAFGLKWTGRITYFTMGCPVILLFVFLGRAVTLEGAQAGIDEYIRHANWEVLSERPEVWSKAVSQIFFSIGISLGVMTAYGSHCQKNEPAFMNSCVVAISNCLFSFIAGFAVFATLGYLANLENLDSVADLEYVSFGLVFGSWPVALGTLPGGEHWIRLFFVMLFLLGIDSAFSLMEGVLTVMQDSHYFSKVNRKLLSLGISVCAFLFSLMYATDAGLVFLDTVDWYINFVLLLVGGFECFAAGWVYNIEGQIERLGANIVFSYMFTTFGSVILACGLWFSKNDNNPDEALWAGFVGLITCYVIGLAVVIFLMHKKKQVDQSLSWKGMFHDLLMRNVLELTNDLSQVVGWMPSVWGFLIKHFIPPVLIVLFALGADEDTVDSEGNTVKKFGNYGNYPTRPYQVLGILVVCFTGFLFVSSLVFPQMYAALQPEIACKKVSSSIDIAPNQSAKVGATTEDVIKDESAPDDIEAQPGDKVGALNEETVA